MNVYKRSVEERVKSLLFKGKVVILYGPRQVGKTTLVKKLVHEYGGAYFLCEEPDVNAALSHKTSTEMKAFLGNKKFIVLDEAQKVHDIGTSLKLLIDNYPDMQIIATGSSSFDLANKMNEPLTGRNYEVMMYPLSISELADARSRLEVNRLLTHHLVYGSYPGVIDSGELAEENLRRITNDYLYKDVLSFGGIRKPDVLQGILRALAFQVGHEVSYSEIASLVGINKETVRSYIDILEKAFIIFRLYPLHKNKRDEIKKLHKVYFYDNGILTTLLQNYNAPEMRDDTGRLFENFFVSEKMKERSYANRLDSVYFWRNKQGGEVDFVEEIRGGESYQAFECKYSMRTAKVPPLFKASYPTASFEIITRENIVSHFLNEE